jgi:methyltransferase
VAAVGAQRLRELALSRSRERGRRGRRAAARSYPLMVAAHVALGTLPLVEVAVRRRRPRPAQALLWTGLLAGATALRWWSIRSLGASWNVRALVPDDLRPVTTGPYRVLRHPNYLAVALEFLALPMAGGATWSALGLSLLDAAVLCDRIRDEERLLAQVPGYQEAFRGRARLLPGIL